MGRYKGIRATLKEYGNAPAVNFRKSFADFRDKVAKMPKMFPVYEYNPNYRAAVLVYDYLIFYKVDEIEKKVMIFRVLHGKRNAPVIL